MDVHPFNPRIAMSAGYDGKTIVWDVSSFLFNPFHISFYYNTAFHQLIPCNLPPDMGRHTSSCIWNWRLKIGWWEVLSVSPHELDSAFLCIVLTKLTFCYSVWPFLFNNLIDGALFLCMRDIFFAPGYMLSRHN